MKIVFLEEVGSTHTYLLEYIQNNGYSEPLCIATQNQTDGIGSRGNSWTGKKGNIFFSFVLHKSLIAKDLPMQSTSIYFSYILKQVLETQGSQVWLKWPNDFYINDKKIGGTITSVKKDLIYCGIGLNLEEVSPDFGYLDIKIEPQKMLKLYFEELKKTTLWKKIFSQFQIEFHKSKNFSTKIDGEKVSLESSVLNDDGSISIGMKKVYSLR